MGENCNSRGSRINKREIVLRTWEAQTVKGRRYPHSTLLYKAAGITGSGNEGKEGNKEVRARKQMCLIFTGRSRRIDDEDGVSSETSLN